MADFCSNSYSGKIPSRVCAVAQLAMMFLLGCNSTKRSPEMLEVDWPVPRAWFELQPVGMLDDEDLNLLVTSEMDGQPPLEKDWEVSGNITFLWKPYYCGVFDRRKLMPNSDCKGFRLWRTDNGWSAADLEAIVEAYPNLTNIYLQTGGETFGKTFLSNLDFEPIAELRDLQHVEFWLPGQIKNADAVFNSARIDSCSVHYLTDDYMSYMSSVDNGGRRQKLDKPVEWTITDCIEGGEIEFTQEVRTDSDFIQCPYWNVRLVNDSSETAKVKQLPKGVQSVIFTGRFDFSDCEPNSDVEHFEWYLSEWRCPDPDLSSWEWWLSEDRTPARGCRRAECLFSFDVRTFPRLRFVCIDSDCTCLTRTTFDVDCLLGNESVKYVMLRMGNGYIRNVDKLRSAFSYAEAHLTNVSLEERKELYSEQRIEEGNDD